MNPRLAETVPLEAEVDGPVRGAPRVEAQGAALGGGAGAAIFAWALHVALFNAEGIWFSPRHGYRTSNYPGLRVLR